MTAPLNKDGSNFPAKKYATKAKLDSLKPVATLVAGQEFSWGLGGTATHNGGSCQIAIRCVSSAFALLWREPLRGSQSPESGLLELDLTA